MRLFGKQLLHAPTNVSQLSSLHTFPGHRAHSLWQCVCLTAAVITVSFLESSFNTILWRGEPLNAALAILAAALSSSKIAALCVPSTELLGLLQNAACLEPIHFPSYTVAL